MARSPAYPAFDVASAIERVRQLYNVQRTNSVYVEAALEVLGYKSVNGTSQRVIAALLSYGLLSEEGSGEARRIRITELARKILLLPETDPERQDAIRDAATTPKIYKEMAARWEDTLPPDTEIRKYLTFDKGFHESATVPLIRDFKASYEFAQLGNRGIMSEVKPDKPETKESHDTPPVGSSPSGNSSNGGSGSGVMTMTLPQQAEMQTFSLPLPGRKMAFLQIPVDISGEEFRFLSEHIGFIARAYDVAPATPPAPRVVQPEMEMSNE